MTQPAVCFFPSRYHTLQTLTKLAGGFGTFSVERQLLGSEGEAGVTCRGEGGGAEGGGVTAGSQSVATVDALYTLYSTSDQQLLFYVKKSHLASRSAPQQVRRKFCCFHELNQLGLKIYIDSMWTITTLSLAELRTHNQPALVQVEDLTVGQMFPQLSPSHFSKHDRWRSLE